MLIFAVDNRVYRHINISLVFITVFLYDQSIRQSINLLTTHIERACISIRKTEQFDGIH